MSDVPSEIFREILLRLPAESLLRFRSVCKSWQNIIDDPLFVQSHTTNNHNSSPRLLLGTTTGAFYSFPLDSLNFVNGEQTIHATHLSHAQKLTNMDMCIPRCGEGVFWTAFCNGLILFFHHLPGKTWVIWNPLTGDFHKIPHPDIIVGHAIPMSVGIGYDSKSDDYKVVRIGGFHEQDGVARTLIYSLKMKSWRVVMNFPYNKIGLMIHGLYLNGAVHWRSFRDMIVALDLATEEYRHLQAGPPLPMESPEQERRLDAFDGYLVLSDAGWEEMGRAWLMRGYGTDEAVWVELFSAEERIVFSGVERCRLPTLLAYSNSERRLIMHHDNRIIQWDIENRCAKKVTIDGLPGSVTSFQVITSLQAVPGNLLRFNGGGSTIMKRSKEASSNRLKLIATTIDCDCSRGGGMSRSGRVFPGSCFVIED